MLKGCLTHAVGNTLPIISSVFVADGSLEADYNDHPGGIRCLLDESNFKEFEISKAVLRDVYNRVLLLVRLDSAACGGSVY